MLSKKELSNLVKTKTVAEIAGMYGVTVQAVYSRCKRNNIDYKKPTTKDLFEENIEEIIEYVQQFSIKEASVKYKISDSFLRKAFNSLGVSFGKTELTKKLLEEELKTGTPNDIAEKYNYHVVVVRKKIKDYGIERTKHGHLINNYFFDTWSSDMAYILGFVFADGTVNTTLHHNKLVVELHPQDRCVLEFIIEKIQPNRNIYEYTHYDKRTGKTYPAVRTDFSSKILVRSLKELGCVERKSYKPIRVPDIPNQYIHGFIRGYFDGDGSVSFFKSKTGQMKRTASIYCSSFRFLEDIKKLIGNYGSIDYNSNPCRLQFCSKENIKKFYDLIYSTEAFHLKRKKQIFDNIFEYDKNRRK